MLLIYKPWLTQQSISDQSGWIDQLQTFIDYLPCLDSLKCKYYGAMYRKQQKLGRKEPLAKDATIRDDEVPSDDEGLLELTGKNGKTNYKNYTRKYPKGKNYDWSQPMTIIITICNNNN